MPHLRMPHHDDWLDSAVEPGDSVPRRKRLLAHLLARFAEQLDDHVRIDPGEPDSADGQLIADRISLLRGYPRLSRARGSGYDVSRHGTSDATVGFEDRLRCKLGIRTPGQLCVVEHVLLRPVSEDSAQLAGEDEPEVPLLAGVSQPDPWSLRVSVVIHAPSGLDASFVPLVEQTVLAEAPVHLSLQLHWLDASDGVDDWTTFETAWSDFRTTYRDYRAARERRAAIPTMLQLRVRDARDRVIDLLGLGRTYPLRDLPVRDEIVVTPSSRAAISIAFSQADTIYELRDRTSGARILEDGVPIAADGTGDSITLTTPPIEVETAYRILAVKRAGAQIAEQRREAWLRTAVRVIPGVDTSLEASIQLPRLDPDPQTPLPGDARIGDWGIAAEIEVRSSQEGVTYQIIEHAADLRDPATHRVLSAPVVATSSVTRLTTVAMTEDIDLRVRGQRTTGTSAQPIVLTGILDIVLPLRIRANPAVPVQLIAAVVDHGGAATLRLDATQASVEYRVCRRAIRDRDFAFGDGQKASTIEVAADGSSVRLWRPVKPHVGQDPTDFHLIGDAAPGNGGRLMLPIGAPTTVDAFLLVQASKRHQRGLLGTGTPETPSTILLDAAVVLLVRPDPAPKLRLEVTIARGATTGSVVVHDGQPGVFYAFSVVDPPLSIRETAYIHQLDDQAPQLNKGIAHDALQPSLERSPRDGLRIGVDLVIARDRSGLAVDPATTPSLPPSIETPRLPAGSVLRVQAKKAMTGLETALAGRAVLDDLPAVTSPPTVARGSSADVVIEASRIREHYWLLRDGQAVGDLQVGTGARIALATGRLTQRTLITLVAMRLDDELLAVERHLDLVIDVT